MIGYKVSQVQDNSLTTCSCRDFHLYRASSYSSMLASQKSWMMFQEPLTRVLSCALNPIATIWNDEIQLSRIGTKRRLWWSRTGVGLVTCDRLRHGYVIKTMYRLSLCVFSKGLKKFMTSSGSVLLAGHSCMNWGHSAGMTAGAGMKTLYVCERMMLHARPVNIQRTFYRAFSICQNSQHVWDIVANT